MIYHLAFLCVVGDSATITARSVATVDSAAWSRADSITVFRQRDPSEGATASERTVVKILRDHDAFGSTVAISVPRPASHQSSAHGDVHDQVRAPDRALTCPDARSCS
jgi:hypothetical protein